MPPDIKITTELLYQGALGFALMDAVYIPLLVWRVKEETFRRLKWPLAIAAALVWFGIWNWAISNFWEDVYSYLFPAWAQTWVPWIAFVAAGIVALGLWTLSLRIKGQPVLVYCLLGGVLGSLTHIWAVYRGVVTKPPMLQGASPLGAAAIAFFEYLFYWCVILTIATIMEWVRTKLERSSQSSRRRRLTASSHTTGHAGPHPAVHREWHKSALEVPSSRAGDARLSAPFLRASPVSLAQ